MRPLGLVKTRCIAKKPLVHRRISALPTIIALLLLAFTAAAQSPPVIGELFASETTSHGPVLLAGTGMSVTSGSQVSAGKSVATLRLERGGEVRVCPNAGITVSTPQNYGIQSSQELMLAMNAGSVELDYPLNDLADTLITPDFKLMLAGPGVFHFALGVSNKGDTCIKPMRGNSAGIIVSEMIGSGVYQVKPDEAVLFAGGKLSGRTPLVGDCGCPKPPPAMVAEEHKPTAEPPASATTAAAAPAPVAVPPASAPPASDGAAPQPEKSDGVHMQVEAPLVFRGDLPVQPAYTVAHIRFSALPNVFLAQENEKPIVLKPGRGEVSAKNKENKGFFGRIKGFFASLFHR